MLTTTARLFSIMLAVVSAAPIASAQRSALTSPARRLLASARLTPPLPTPVEARLKNGLTLIVLEDRRSPIVTFSLATSGAGSYHDAAGSAGLAAAVVGTLRQQLMQDTQLSALLQRSGAQLVPTVAPGYAEISGAALTAQFASVLNAAARMVKTRTLSSDVFERELTRSRSRYTSQYLAGGSGASNTASTELLANAIFGRRVGEEAAFLSAEQFHRRNFRPEATMLAVAGDISLEETRQLAGEAFDDWAGAQAADTRARDEVSEVNPSRAILVPVEGMPRVRVNVAAESPEQFSRASYAMEVLNALCYERLLRRLRVQKGYAYDTPTAITGAADRMMWSVFMDVAAERADAALHDLLTEIENFRSTLVSASELQASKNGLIAGVPIRMETQRRVVELQIQRAIGGMPRDYWGTYPLHIAAVTSDDIRAVAQKYLNAARLFVVAIGEPKAAEAMLHKRGTPTKRLQSLAK